MTDQLKLNWLQSCQTHPNRFQSVGYFWSDKENLKIDFKGQLNFKFSFSDVTAVHLPRHRWRHHPRRGHHAGTFFYHLSKQSLERLYVLVLKYYSALGCGEDLFFLWMHGPSRIKRHRSSLAQDPSIVAYINSKHNNASGKEIVVTLWQHVK